MNDIFPTLKTGAVMQYPAVRSVQYKTEVIQFLDGSEQRFRDSPSALHRWIIALDLLDETELAALDQFFVTNQGRFGAFAFTDPWDGTVYPNCSLEDDLFGFQLRSEMRGGTMLIVRENRI